MIYRESKRKLDFTPLSKYLFLKDKKRLKGEMNWANHGVDGLV